MSNYLFLYGTLLPEHAPDEIARAIAKLRRLGTGALRGLLYDFGEFPGAILAQDENCHRIEAPVLDDSEDGQIHGVVFELPDDEELLRTLDRYEDFDSKNVETSLFVRRLQPVTLASGGVLQCWIYIYNREPAGARRIPSGRY